jgi:acyl carrier protein
MEAKAQTQGDIDIDRILRVLTRVMRERRKPVPDDIGPATRLDELDLDSLDVAEVFINLEDDLGYRLDSETIGDPEVVADLAQIRPAA